MYYWYHKSLNYEVLDSSRQSLNKSHLIIWKQIWRMMTFSGKKGYYWGLDWRLCIVSLPFWLGSFPRIRWKIQFSESLFVSQAFWHLSTCWWFAHSVLRNSSSTASRQSPSEFLSINEDIPGRREHWNGERQQGKKLIEVIFLGLYKSE